MYSNERHDKQIGHSSSLASSSVAVNQISPLKSEADTAPMWVTIGITESNDRSEEDPIEPKQREPETKAEIRNQTITVASTAAAELAAEECSVNVAGRNQDGLNSSYVSGSDDMKICDDTTNAT